jgi:hypothetical protein
MGTFLLWTEGDIFIVERQSIRFGNRQFGDEHPLVESSI